MTTQMSCLFNTPKHSWTHSPHHHHHHYLSYKSLFTSTQPLSSPFAPLLFLPSLSVGSHCIWRVRERGRKKGEKGRQSAREREGRRESVRPLAVRESAPGWASFLDMLWGAIVLHVSSPSLLMGPVYHHSDYGRWLGLWGWGGGGDGRSGRNVHVCVRYRKKESVLGREVGWRRGLGTEA